MFEGGVDVLVSVVQRGLSIGRCKANGLGSVGAVVHLSLLSLSVSVALGRYSDDHTLKLQPTDTCRNPIRKSTLGL